MQKQSSIFPKIFSILFQAANLYSSFILSNPFVAQFDSVNANWQGDKIQVLLPH
jgi:hypothetical protein